MYLVVIFVPADYAHLIRKALADSKAGSVGPYDSGSFTSTGISRFRALEGAKPVLGCVGSVTDVIEEKIEVDVSEENITSVLSAVLEVHPYEYPSIQVIPMIDYTKFLTQKTTRFPFVIDIESNDSETSSLVAANLARRLNGSFIQSLPRDLVESSAWFSSQGSIFSSGYIVAGLKLASVEIEDGKRAQKCILLNSFVKTVEMVAMAMGGKWRQELDSSNTEVDGYWPSILSKPDMVFDLQRAGSEVRLSDDVKQDKKDNKNGEAFASSSVTSPSSTYGGIPRHFVSMDDRVSVDEISERIISIITAVYLNPIGR